jgi:hypothetical protein
MTTEVEWRQADDLVREWLKQVERDRQRGRELLLALQPEKPTGAMAQQCPLCGAAPGWWCARPNGVMILYLHAKRREAAAC